MFTNATSGRVRYSTAGRKKNTAVYTINVNGLLKQQTKAAYAQHARAPLYDRMFPILLSAVITAFVFGGITMKKIPAPLREYAAATIRQVQAHARILEPVKPKAVVKQPRQIVQRAPADLTDMPKLSQKAEEPTTAAPKENVRRVYGLRKVYSRGIGAGGTMADAVIGKLGNTIQKDFDTLTATAQEIKGQIVSATTVTQAPKFKKQVKPEYTKEMIDNRIQGVVKVKVLVDIDGKVKKALALNDLGHNTASEAMKATLEMEFTPALRENEPVAVWIVIPIRFIMLG